MKKTFGMFMAMALAFTTLAGCGQKAEPDALSLTATESIDSATSAGEKTGQTDEQGDETQVKKENEDKNQDSKDKESKDKESKDKENKDGKQEQEKKQENAAASGDNKVAKADSKNKRNAQGNNKNNNSGNNQGQEVLGEKRPGNGNTGNNGNGNGGNKGNNGNSGSNSGSGNQSGNGGNKPGKNTGKAVKLNVKEHAVPAGNTPDANPLKGLMPFAGTTSFPHSMEWFYIGVNEVETAEGVYDWTALESRLAPIAERGHQAVLRFYYDYPGEDPGVPQYLIDKYGLEMKPYNEPDDLGGSGLCPDYSNIHFRKSMQNFVAAFGKKYDGDPRIGYITEGLLGFWGEWHNWPFDEDTSDGKPNWNIPPEVYSEIYAAYDNAFDITGLVVREPKDGVDNASYATGYHDDSFAYATLSAENGGQDWSFMQRLKNHGVDGNWEFGCIGGEVYPPLQGEVFRDTPTGSFGEPIQDWNKCVNETHASWLMCDQIKGFQGSTRDNAIKASKGLGYDLQVTKAYYSETVGKDTGLPLKLEIKNNGVAPFYYDHRTWPVMIGVKKGDDLIKKWETDWDLPAVKADGKPVLFQTTIDKHGLGDGKYTLCVKVKNPLKGGVLFHFANEGELSGGWLSLGTFEVKGAGKINSGAVEDDPGPGEYTEPEPVPDGTDGLYEAERGKLIGKASISENYKASGGKMVGWIGTGDGDSGSLLIDHVEVPEAGEYTAEIAYVLGEAQRFAYIDVNDSDTVEVRFTSTGGWSTLGTRRFGLNLKEGVNTLLIHNDTGYSPDIDYVKIVKKGYSPEADEPGTPENPGGDDPVDPADPSSPGGGDPEAPTDPGEPLYFDKGTLTDWSGVDAAFRNDSYNIWVKDDEEYVYFATAYTYDNLQHWQVMVEADGNVETGMTSPWPLSPGGVDYMVEGDLNGGSLAYKKSSDTDWNWDYDISVENPIGTSISADNRTIELKIKKAALNNQDRPLSDDIGFGFRYVDGDWAEIASSNSGEAISYHLAAGN